MNSAAPAWYVQYILVLHCVTTDTLFQRDVAHYAMMFPLLFPLQATTLSHTSISLLSQQPLLPYTTYTQNAKLNCQVKHKETSQYSIKTQGNKLTFKYLEARCANIIPCG